MLSLVTLSLLVISAAATSSILSQRGEEYLIDNNLLSVGWDKCASNKYTSQNEAGCINMGTSELRLVYDLITQKIAEVNAVTVPEYLTHYLRHQGDLFFRNATANLLNKYMTPTHAIGSEDVFVYNGCGSACESLGFILFDEKDGLMLPSPYYGGYVLDFTKRPKAQLVPVYVNNDNGFKVTQEGLDIAFANAVNQGIRVRALLITNPENPTGVMYDKDTLTTCIQFAIKHDLHLIVNELYFLSRHAPSQHISVLSLPDNQLPNPDKLHVIWGFSKSFGISGFRVGCIITRSSQVQAALKQTAYFTGISGMMQHQLGSMISDLDWVDAFLTESNTRLHHSYQMVATRMDRLGIPYLANQAAFFLWIDLSSLLSSPTNQSELEVWYQLIDRGLYIAPSAAFQSKESGWFRFMYADQPRILTLALDRFEAYFQERRVQLASTSSHTLNPDKLEL